MSDRRREQLREAKARQRARDRGEDVPLRKAKEAACGTPAGYRRHRSRGETPCDDCKAAVAKAERLRRLARRQARPSSSSTS